MSGMSRSVWGRGYNIGEQSYILCSTLGKWGRDSKWFGDRARYLSWWGQERGGCAGAQGLSCWCLLLCGA